ncbi:MAG: type II toxin-antitoxin system ParD family antitoxin [Phycisphaerales bacterium]|nr:type II toxin-antitoxin system ParD family antitoxin [Phycisphaerales bacterium]
MPAKDTLNVSLTPELAGFVDSQVRGGQYRSASEVVRAALRLLERDERDRLFQKWLLKGELTAEEATRLPEDVRGRMRRALSWRVEDGQESLRRGEGVAGEEVLERWERRLRALDDAERDRKSA